MKKLSTLFVGVFCVICFTNSYSQSAIINTIVGNGITGFSGDGWQATSAELNGPFYLYVDKSGNLLIPDRNNERVRQVNTSGVISTIAGNGVLGYYGDGGPATAAEFYWPEAVATDAGGNIYIADHKNNAIRMVNTSGIIKTIAGNGYTGYTGNGGQATSAELNSPIGIAIDTSSGNIYFTDAGNYCVRKINMSGYISTVTGNTFNGYSGDGGAATSAEIGWPTDIVVDVSGNLFICDFGNNCIRKVNGSGIISTIAGNYSYGAGYSGNGGPATAAEMNLPSGLVLHGTNLLITEENNNCVREVNTTTGIISTYAGNTIAGFSGDGGAAIASELAEPIGVAVNSAGKVFISDYGNSRIREVTPNTEGINNLIGTANNVLVYPNPAKVAIYVQIQNSIKTKKVLLYSVIGQEMLENNSEGKQNIEISTSGLSDGVYFVRVLMTDGNSIVKKIEVVK